MTATLDGDLITVVDGERRLVGARCAACGTHTFPVQAGCPRCGADTEPAALPTRGTVWSWTVQRIAPKAPFVVAGDYEPFTVAYVDLGPLKVEGRLSGRAPGAWPIGTEVALVVGDDGAVPLYWFEATSPGAVAP